MQPVVRRRVLALVRRLALRGPQVRQELPEPERLVPPVPLAQRAPQAPEVWPRSVAARLAPLLAVLAARRPLS